MATNPNVTFVAGAVYTADQANRLPFGVMNFTKKTTTSTFTSETTQITTTFTAETNRLYKMTYLEPTLLGSTASNAVLRIKKGATILNQTNQMINVLGQSSAGVCIHFNIFTAGSTTITATLQASAGTGTASRGSTNYAFLLIEDMGPY